MATNRLTTLNRDANKFSINAIEKTILVSDWVDDTVTSGYWYCNISNAYILSTNRIRVDFTIDSLQYTSNILKTCESFDGYVRIYAKNQPISNIDCVITIENGIINI